MHIFDEDIDHLKEHPDDARWIKNQVDSRLWDRLLSHGLPENMLDQVSADPHENVGEESPKGS